MEEILAPLAIGAVIGWIVSFFIRKYEHFTSKTLLGTSLSPWICPLFQ